MEIRKGGRIPCSSPSPDAPAARATGEILLTRNIDAATWTYDAEAEGGALVEIEWRAANPFVVVVR